MLVIVFLRSAVNVFIMPIGLIQFMFIRKFVDHVLYLGLLPKLAMYYRPIMHAQLFIKVGHIASACTSLYRGLVWGPASISNQLGGMAGLALWIRH